MSSMPARPSCCACWRGGCAPNRPDDAPTTSCALQARPMAVRAFVVLAANVLAAGGQPLLAAHLGADGYGGVQRGLHRRRHPRHAVNIVVPSGVAGLRFEDEAEAINRAAEALRCPGREGPGGPGARGRRDRHAAGAPADWNDPVLPRLAWRHGAHCPAASRPKVDVIFSAHTHQGYNCLHRRPAGAAGAELQGRGGVGGRSGDRPGAAARSTAPATRSRNLPVLNERVRCLPSASACWPASRAAGAGPKRCAQAQPVAAVAADGGRLCPGRGAAGAAAGGPHRRAGFDRARPHRQQPPAAWWPMPSWAATRAPDQRRRPAGADEPRRRALRTWPAAGTPPCTVTYGDAFGMQPFGNSLVVMTLTGVELKAVLEAAAAARAAASPVVPVSRRPGCAYRWVASAPHGPAGAGPAAGGPPGAASGQRAPDGQQLHGRRR